MKRANCKPVHSASAHSTGDEKQPTKYQLLPTPLPNCQVLDAQGLAACAPGQISQCNSPDLKRRAVCWKSCAKPMWSLVPLLTGTTLASATLKLCPYLTMHTPDPEPDSEIEQCWPIGYHHQTCSALLAVVLWGWNLCGSFASCAAIPTPQDLWTLSSSHTKQAGILTLRSRQASGRDSYNG